MISDWHIPFKKYNIYAFVTCFECYYINFYKEMLINNTKTIKQ